MQFTMVKVRCTNPDYLDISWEVDHPGIDPLAFEYTLERGESPEGPFEVIKSGLKDTYQFRDYIAPRKRAWRNLYYRVKASSAKGDILSEPTNCLPRAPLDGLEMTRLHNMLLKEYVGRPCLVLVSRTFGSRCTACYDRVTGRRTVSRCPTCWNTGFHHGYHRPIVAYIQIDPNDKSQINTSELVSEQALTNARMSIYPLLKPRDIIVEQEGTRWRINSVRQTERLRSPIHQEVSLVRIPNGDIEYKIPVSVPDSIETSPRSFSYKDDL
jgi:hypothetical protein